MTPKGMLVTLARSASGRACSSPARGHECRVSFAMPNGLKNTSPAGTRPGDRSDDRSASTGICPTISRDLSIRRDPSVAARSTPGSRCRCRRVVMCSGVISWRSASMMIANWRQWPPRTESWSPWSSMSGVGGRCRSPACLTPLSGPWRALGFRPLAMQLVDPEGTLMKDDEAVLAKKLTERADRAGGKNAPRP